MIPLAWIKKMWYHGSCCNRHHDLINIELHATLKITFKPWTSAYRGVTGTLDCFHSTKRKIIRVLKMFDNHCANLTPTKPQDLSRDDWYHQHPDQMKKSEYQVLMMKLIMPPAPKSFLSQIYLSHPSMYTHHNEGDITSSPHPAIYQPLKRLWQRRIRQIYTKSLLDCHPLSTEFIIRWESCWMGGFCHLPIWGRFLERIHPFAIFVQVIHQMHVAVRNLRRLGMRMPSERVFLEGYGS